MAPQLAQSHDNIDLHEKRTSTRLVARPEGPACVLAIGSAFPAAVIDQSTYHETLFAMCGVTDNEPLKAKFQRLCERSCIETRHTFVTPDLIREHPELATFNENSLSTRVEIANKVIPELAVQAARGAAREWGRPLAAITHLVLCTTGATAIPGTDLAVARALGLAPSVERVCLYQTGCWGGPAATRVGRVLAESTRHARVLVIAVEANSVMNFRRPMEESLQVDHLMAHCILADGAAALILGCEALVTEHPLYEIHWSAQLSPPDSQAAIHGNLSESGLIQHLQTDALPKLIAKHLGELTSGARALVGSPSHDDMFWVVHPGGYLIMDVVEETLGLAKEQLQASRDVLRRYGNCASPTSLLVLDEMRRRSQRLDEGTTGAGCEWGMLVGFGPGFNIEVSLLRSVPLT